MAVAWILAALLPLVGLVSLLARSKLDPGWTNTRVHFVLFLSVATVDFVLSYAAADAARRRGDARVLLISLAFLATGAFLGLHSVGTPMVLFTDEYAGFKVACPLNKPGEYSELASFLGASYFRMLGKDQRYGSSARGLALDSGEPDRPEEFPLFTDFWLGKPAPSRCSCQSRSSTGDAMSSVAARKS